MRIDMLGGSYENKYKDFNAQLSINWYPVVGTQNEVTKSPNAIFPTPGLELYITLPGRYIRGMFFASTVTWPKRCFVVCDTTLYEIFHDRSYTSRGSVANLIQGPSKVWMACNGNNQLIVVNNNAGYVYDLTSGILDPITDPDFPTLETLDYMDGYFVGTKNGRIYYSELNNGLSWIATDVITPTFKADPCVATKCFRELLYNFGMETTEFYVNDGSTPFIRQPQSSITVGCVAPESIAQFDKGHVFLGRTRNGEVKVYINQEFEATAISPYPINWRLNNSGGDLSAAYGWIQDTKDGHNWYFITVPGSGTTFVWDMDSNQWHERRSKKPGNDSDGSYVYNEFRGRHYVNYDGEHLYGDLYSGKIFLESYKTAEEDDELIRRIRRSQTFTTEHLNISATSLDIDANTGEAAVVTGQGSDPKLMVSISKDGGYNFDGARDVLLGTIGKYTYRAKLTKLGSARNWVIEMSCTDPIDLMIQNAYVHGSTGAV